MTKDCKCRKEYERNQLFLQIYDYKKVISKRDIVLIKKNMCYSFWDEVQVIKELCWSEKIERSGLLSICISMDASMAWFSLLRRKQMEIIAMYELESPVTWLTECYVVYIVELSHLLFSVFCHLKQKKNLYSLYTWRKLKVCWVITHYVRT